MESDWVPVAVHCRSDYTYAQEPQEVQWPDGRWLPVRVLSSSRQPDGPGFRVSVAEPDRVIQLRYVEAEDRWLARPLP